MFGRVLAGVGGLLILGGGGMLYKYFFGKKNILLDGVEGAGKTTLSKLLVGEEATKNEKRTVDAHVKTGRGYAIYDVPGDDGEIPRIRREKAFRQVSKKDDVLYIYVFNATKRLENDDREKKRFNFALGECKEKGWGFITIGSRRDEITEEERKGIESDSRAKGAECRIFNLCDSQSLGEIEDYINEYLKIERV